jgi:hypothetical protein
MTRQGVIPEATDDQIDMGTIAGLCEHKRRYPHLYPTVDPATVKAGLQELHQLAWANRRPIRKREHAGTAASPVLAAAGRKARLMMRVNRTGIQRDIQLSRRLSQRHIKPAAGGERRPASRRRNSRSRKLAPSGGARSSSGDSPGPIADPDPLGLGVLTDVEARHVAAHVAELYPDTLTPARFYIAVSPWVGALPDGQQGEAKRQIFDAMPEPCRVSFRSHMRIGHATLAPRDAACGRHLDRGDELGEGGAS